MKILKTHSLVCGFLLCFILSNAQKPKFSLDGVEVVDFASSINKQKYKLYVKLPGELQPGKKYPVLYVTDGQWFFTPFYPAYSSLNYDGLIPEIILVGIAFSPNYSENRIRDFTPILAKSGAQQSSDDSKGAKVFLSVIKNEIIKYIDSIYPTDTNDRALYGTSLGGLFAIYSLFNEPDLFKSYIISSPYIQFDHDWTFRSEKEFAKKSRALNTRVFFSVGELEPKENVDSFNLFVKQITTSKYKGFTSRKIIIPDIGHSSAGTMSAILGLRYLYGRTKQDMEK